MMRLARVALIAALAAALGGFKPPKQELSIAAAADLQAAMAGAALVVGGALSTIARVAAEAVGLPLAWRRALCSTEGLAQGTPSITTSRSE